MVERSEGYLRYVFTISITSSAASVCSEFGFRFGSSTWCRIWPSRSSVIRLLTAPLAALMICNTSEQSRPSSRIRSRASNCPRVASYLGLVPLEDSSGNRRRLGHITKQGSSILRFLLVEAAQVTVRSVPEWRSKYFHLALRRGRKIAKVAMARKLAVRLYWMWRKGWNYEQWTKFGSHAGQPGNRDGVPSNTE
jgi:hypothetical protein